MKKLLAMLLVLGMALALCACGGSGSSEKSIVGKWEGTVDMADLLVAEVDASVQSSLNTSVSYGDYLKEMPCKFTAEFNQDGTYRYQMDASDSRDLLKNATYNYYYAVLTELLGTAPTDELIRSTLGMDLDTYAGQIADQSLQGLKSMGTTSGKYEIDGNKIVYDGNSNQYETFTLSGDKLTIHVSGIGDIDFTRK